MPEIGEIKKGHEIGYRGNSYIWTACIDCGKERWVRLRKGEPRSLKCNPCAHPRGVEHPAWKGGRISVRRDSGTCYKEDGYVRVWLSEDSFFSSMCNKRGYVYEHRLVMAQHLGRCLQPWELVHHKDGKRDHNVYSNLKMTTRGSHAIEHHKGYKDGYRQGYQDGQNSRIEELKQQNEELLKHINLVEWQLKQKQGVELE